MTLLARYVKHLAEDGQDWLGTLARRRLPVAGFSIDVPAGTTLSVMWRRNPNYDRPIDEIGRYLRSTEAPGAVLDIGANIGDSVARLWGAESICAVEAHPRFVPWLKSNVELLLEQHAARAPGRSGSRTRVQIVEAYIGSERGSVSMVDTNFGSSARQAEGDAPSSFRVRTCRIEDLVEQGALAQPVLGIKTDTDGSDFSILLGHDGWIARARPFILFEFDPYLSSEVLGGGDGHAQAERCLDMLQACGYTRYLVFDNFGNLLADLKDGSYRQRLAELRRYLEQVRQMSRPAVIYYDILACGAAHQALADAVAASYAAYPVRPPSASSSSA